MSRRFHTPHPSRVALALVALAALSLGACGTERMDTTGQPAPPMLTDANISSIVMTANTGEIEQSQLALQKSQNAQVREFAQMMISEHTAANQNLQMALRDMRLQPVPNATTQQLMTTSRQTVESLQARSGNDFDRTYMDTQIAQHRWQLQTLNDALIPTADDRELREVLMELRPRVAAHLEHAQRIRASLPSQ